MNSILVCICGIVLTVLAVHASQDVQGSGKPQSGTLTPPFNFDYEIGDYLYATVKLINLSPDVIYRIQYEEESQMTQERVIENKAGREDHSVHHQLLKENILISLRLINQNSWCTEIVMFRGEAVDSNRTAAHPTPNYNERCLRSFSPCILEMYLTDKCLVKPQGDILRPQFNFGYNKGDYLNAVVNFINLSPALRYNILVVDGGDGDAYTIKTKDPISSRTLGRNYYYPIHQHLLNQTWTWVYVSVFTERGRCASINLFHGRAVNRFMVPQFYYNDTCLKSTSPCIMKVDLKNVTCSDPPVVSDNITSTYNVSASPDEDMETTTVSNSARVSNKSDVSTSRTSNVIVIIVSSLSGITFVALVIIAIWKRRCWMQRTPQGTLGLQANQDNFQPFYLNLLFRRECEREIQEIEAHVYEEIGDPVYEEINPTIDEEIGPSAAGDGCG